MPDCLEVALHLSGVLQRDKLLALIHLYGQQGKKEVARKAKGIGIKNPYKVIRQLKAKGLVYSPSYDKVEVVEVLLLSSSGKRRLGNLLRDLEKKGICKNASASVGVATVATSENWMEPLLTRLEQLELHDLEFKEWLDEVQLCARYGAKRATVVLLWQLLIACLVSYAISTKGSILKEVSRTNSKKALSSLDDVQEFKESKLLDIMKSAGIVSKNEKAILENLLRIRNLAAHPNFYKFSEAKTASFFEDIISFLEKYCT